MKGLYFYKLVSPYREDETKDCKLTVNEIDHNFLTLKDADIVDFQFDKESNAITLTRRDGEKMSTDLSELIPEANVVTVEYDPKEGIITLKHDDQVDVIDKLVTLDNCAKNIVKYTVADNTLCGTGKEDSPLGLNPTEQTSAFKSVKCLINKTQDEELPIENIGKGDRYLTYEEVSKYGYLYNFRHAMMLNDDLAHGWRIPTKADWDNMLNAIEMCDDDRNHDSLICNTMLGKLAGSFLKSTDEWKENENDNEEDRHDKRPRPNKKNADGRDKFGMDVLPGGYGDGDSVMEYFGQRGKFWTQTVSHVSDVFTKRFDYDKTGVVQLADNPSNLYSIRLVKDYNGHNFTGVDTILGVTYNTALLPSFNTSHGFSIWTTSNIAAHQLKYHPVDPTEGENYETRKAFIMNEWDGEDWRKKELKDGDTLVIHNGPDGDTDREYRLVNGELVNIARDIISIVMDKYDNDIHDLQDRMETVETDVETLKSTTDTLVSEMEDRKAVDAQMWSAIENEVQTRENVDNQLWAAVENETQTRENVDNQLWATIANETQTRENVDNQLWAAVENEIQTRENVDNQLWVAVENEINRAVAEDVYIKGRLVNEESSKYNCADGTLTLGTDDPNNTITIKLNGNYGTF